MRQIISAEVEGSWAGFFEPVDAEPFAEGAVGVVEGLPLLPPFTASSDDWPFFLRAMEKVPDRRVSTAESGECRWSVTMNNFWDRVLATRRFIP